jgi:hypothetical protein
MEYIIVLLFIGLLGYGIYKIVFQKETVEEVKKEAEAVVDKAGEEIKANIDAKTEEAFVKAMEESAKIINVPKETAELLDKVQEAITTEAKEAAAEIVEVVEVKTKKVRAKAKAIEAAIEEKAEKLETAVKKTKAKAKKNG